MDKLLEKILTTRRCHNSQGELQFAAWLHGQLKSLGYEPKAMAEGCVVVENGPSKVMFSCHIDTVHSKQESDTSPTQNLFYDDAMQHIFLNDETSTCLGADDGAGIYIMLKMLEAKVKGTYVFHRGEEKGCIGSRAMLAKHLEWIEKHDACIAFDRPNEHEIIIEQSGLVCASETYGRALAAAFNTLNSDFKYEISRRGVVTDSKTYAYAISECINIGVGYAQQHGKEEYQNVAHLEALKDAVIALEWDKLPITRVCPEAPKPRVYENDYRGHYGNHLGGAFHTQNSSLFRDDRDPFADLKKPAKKATKKKGGAVVQPLKSVAKPMEPDLKLCDEIQNMDYDELVDYVGDSELAKAFIHLQAKTVAAEAKAAFLIRVMGLDV